MPPLTLLHRSILIKYWLSSGAASHGDKVRRVQEQVRARAGRKMCTARPSWMSISQQRLGYKDRMCRVRLDMLQVEPVSRVTCYVSRVLCNVSSVTCCRTSCVWTARP